MASVAVDSTADTSAATTAAPPASLTHSHPSTQVPGPTPPPRNFFSSRNPETEKSSSKPIQIFTSTCSSTMTSIPSSARAVPTSHGDPLPPPPPLSSSTPPPPPPVPPSDFQSVTSPPPPDLPPPPDFISNSSSPPPPPPPPSYLFPELSTEELPPPPPPHMFLDIQPPVAPFYVCSYDPPSPEIKSEYDPKLPPGFSSNAQQSFVSPPPPPVPPPPRPSPPPPPTPPVRQASKENIMAQEPPATPEDTACMLESSAQLRSSSSYLASEEPDTKDSAERTVEYPSKDTSEESFDGRPTSSLMSSSTLTATLLLTPESGLSPLPPHALRVSPVPTEPVTSALSQVTDDLTTTSSSTEMMSTPNFFDNSKDSTLDMDTPEATPQLSETPGTLPCTSPRALSPSHGISSPTMTSGTCDSPIPDSSKSDDMLPNSDMSFSESYSKSSEWSDLETLVDSNTGGTTTTGVAHLSSPFSTEPPSLFSLPTDSDTISAEFDSLAADTLSPMADFDSLTAEVDTVRASDTFLTSSSSPGYSDTAYATADSTLESSAMSPAFTDSCTITPVPSDYATPMSTNPTTTPIPSPILTEGYSPIPSPPIPMYDTYPYPPVRIVPYHPSGPSLPQNSCQTSTSNTVVVSMMASQRAKTRLVASQSNAQASSVTSPMITSDRSDIKQLSLESADKEDPKGELGNSDTSNQVDDDRNLVSKDSVKETCDEDMIPESSLTIEKEEEHSVSQDASSETQDVLKATTEDIDHKGNTSEELDSGQILTKDPDEMQERNNQESMPEEQVSRNVMSKEASQQEKSEDVIDKHITKDILLEEQGKGEDVIDKQTTKDILLEEQGKSEEVIDKQTSKDILLEEQGKSEDVIDKQTTKDIVLEKQGKSEDVIDKQTTKDIVQEEQGKSEDVIDKQTTKDIVPEEQGKSEDVIDKQTTKDILLDEQGKSEDVIDKQTTKDILLEEQGKSEDVIDKQTTKDIVLEEQGKSEGVIEKQISKDIVLEEQGKREDVINKQITKDILQKQGKSEGVIAKHITEDTLIEGQGKSKSVIDEYIAKDTLLKEEQTKEDITKETGLDSKDEAGTTGGLKMEPLEHDDSGVHALSKIPEETVPHVINAKESTIDESDKERMSEMSGEDITENIVSATQVSGVHLGERSVVLENDSKEGIMTKIEDTKDREPCHTHETYKSEISYEAEKKERATKIMKHETDDIKSEFRNEVKDKEDLKLALKQYESDSFGNDSVDNKSEEIGRSVDITVVRGENQEKFSDKGRKDIDYSDNERLELPLRREELQDEPNVTLNITGKSSGTEPNNITEHSVSNDREPSSPYFVPVLRSPLAPKTVRPSQIESSSPQDTKGSPTSFQCVNVSVEGAESSQKVPPCLPSDVSYTSKKISRIKSLSKSPVEAMELLDTVIGNMEDMSASLPSSPQPKHETFQAAEAYRNTDGNYCKTQSETNIDNIDTELTHTAVASTISSTDRPGVDKSQFSGKENVCESEETGKAPTTQKSSREFSTDDMSIDSSPRLESSTFPAYDDENVQNETASISQDSSDRSSPSSLHSNASVVHVLPSTCNVPLPSPLCHSHITHATNLDLDAKEMSLNSTEIESHKNKIEDRVSGQNVANGSQERSPVSETTKKIADMLDLNSPVAKDISLVTDSDLKTTFEKDHVNENLQESPKDILKDRSSINVSQTTTNGTLSSLSSSPPLHSTLVDASSQPEYRAKTPPLPPPRSCINTPRQISGAPLPPPRQYMLIPISQSHAINRRQSPPPAPPRSTSIRKSPPPPPPPLPHLSRSAIHAPTTQCEWSEFPPLPPPPTSCVNTPSTPPAKLTPVPEETSSPSYLPAESEISEMSEALKSRPKESPSPFANTESLLKPMFSDQSEEGKIEKEASAGGISSENNAKAEEPIVNGDLPPELPPPPDEDSEEEPPPPPPPPVESEDELFLPPHPLPPPPLSNTVLTSSTPPPPPTRIKVTTPPVPPLPSTPDLLSESSAQRSSPLHSPSENDKETTNKGSIPPASEPATGVRDKCAMSSSGASSTTESPAVTQTSVFDISSATVASVVKAPPLPPPIPSSMNSLSQSTPSQSIPIAPQVPLSPKSALFKVTPYGKTVIDRSDIPLPTPEEEIRKVLVNVKNWGLLDEGVDTLSLYTQLRPCIQQGPQCGIVALSMASQVFPETVDVADLLKDAKSRGFTSHGEMFSCNDVASLAESISGVQATVRRDVLCDSRKVLEILMQGDLILVPYDAEHNYMPGLRGGYKAHWGIICGCLVQCEALNVHVGGASKLDSRMDNLWHFRPRSRRGTSSVMRSRDGSVTPSTPLITSSPRLSHRILKTPDPSTAISAEDSKTPEGFTKESSMIKSFDVDTWSVSSSRVNTPMIPELPNEEMKMVVLWRQGKSRALVPSSVEKLCESNDQLYSYPSATTPIEHEFVIGSVQDGLAGQVVVLHKTKTALSDLVGILQEK